MIKVSDEDIIKVCHESDSMSEANSKLQMHFNTFKRRALLLGCYVPNQGLKGSEKPKVQDGTKVFKTDDILNGLHPHYQTFKLRNRLIKENIKEYKCEICGISEWKGQRLGLELDHKDGNSNNHILSNLQLICPNCHSQTSNFRSKNIK